jgi:hypothetical protein
MTASAPVTAIENVTATAIVIEIGITTAATEATAQVHPTTETHGIVHGALDESAAVGGEETLGSGQDRLFVERRGIAMGRATIGTETRAIPALAVNHPKAHEAAVAVPIATATLLRPTRTVAQ